MATPAPEPNTVNEELHARNEEPGRINSDLVNLLNGTRIAIVIVASDLRIRRFDPPAERAINLIPRDVGRPITQIKPDVNAPDLERMIAKPWIRKCAFRGVSDAFCKHFRVTKGKWRGVCSIKWAMASGMSQNCENWSPMCSTL